MPGLLWTLCYHDVEDFARSCMLSSHCVNISRIISDLQALRATGWGIIHRKENYRSLYGNKGELEEDKVLLTFDDGYASQIDALHWLGRELEVGALLFVIVGSVGKKGFADWHSLRELAEAGYGVQSHGYSHAVLTSLDWRSLIDEMKRSREELQAHIGQCVWGLAVPQGFYNRRVLLAARQAGYEVLFTSRYGAGTRYHRGSGIILVNRIVEHGDRVQKAIYYLKNNSLPGWWFRLVGRCQDDFKNLLGYRVTSVLWKILHSHR